ncbi:RagB/SusD family nutrient uptake outer membrane protein [Chitinophaga polysaccharea]|uniref:RagB/SusD family nutrient uptake outer membrane protein n=1 Tax=Chitinophaga TaxID=79328 RepID=UPI0014550E55|nr:MULTISPECIES: RagB/SusD family nutrient uptake outer membrane protein [Chitinophaga]NLR60295.1 RagB/SusD family nutrient uptake outer membrane protein [Chitinophaga polysaccharea]NLU95943.1 RagB/SusD family nutrient uptake outer membrane protein [Chitinophaga sp. Ak27]
MKKNHLILAIALSALLLPACGKYTDIKTAGAITPTDYNSFRYLMNNNQVLENGVDAPDITSDDITLSDAGIQQNTGTDNMRQYMWSADFYDAVTADPDWKNLYAAIYTCNLVTDQVMNSTGGTLALKKQVLAEAKVHRAYNYFTLVNMYARQYDRTTSATDPGVPLLLKADVAVTAKRATVQEVYNSILDDLRTAVDDLPLHNTYNIYPSKAAAYALLARVCLQMGDYVNAGSYADNTLQIQNGLLDLPVVTNYPQRIDDPEIILSKTSRNSHAYYAYQVLSNDLLALYQPDDYRYSYLTKTLSLSGVNYRVYAKEIVSGNNRNIGLAVPEVMLVKAESLARAGQANAAMDMLNTLRAKRFAATAYTPLTATSASDALVKVLEERRRELCCRCIRWFDQKRLFTDDRFAKSITRTNIATGKTFTLLPGSNRYLFPIPAYNIQLNPALQQNPR